MKFSRKASAIWEGTGMDGKGTLSTQSGVLDQTNYSFTTRFKDEIGTNPEELIGAAHAGCFTMQLSFLISRANYVPTKLETEATVFFEDGAIPQIKLHLTGQVPDLSKEAFEGFANEAGNSQFRRNVALRTVILRIGYALITRSNGCALVVFG